MVKRSLIVLFLISGVSITAFSQKIKYKDVFSLLSTRQYEAAEPYLKQYLKENDDNPNAFLYMGIIYQEKSMKADILRNTEVALNQMDSAIYYFDKAYKTIDEKELKRNKDYYAMYFRRDLRSGEYGVKISDVQFEIEKSKEALNERIDKVKMVKHYFKMAEDLYTRSNELFKTIQAAFPGERELYLRSDEKTLSDLSRLAARFDSCANAFEHYKSSLGNIPKSGYDQTWELLEIKDFKSDGVQVTSFYEPKLQIWDYKNFATSVKTVVEKELMPIREKLVKYDVEINKLRERLIQDSVSVKSDLTKLLDNLLAEKLVRFDPNPLPLNVLALKVAKLEYQSTLVENRKLRDSSDVFFKVKLVKDEIKYVKKVDSLAFGLLERNIEEEAKNYSYFVTNTYNNVGLLKSYVKTEKDFTDREKQKKNSELAYRMKALDWIVAGNDSIPLVMGNSRNGFTPILVENNKYTTGINTSDSLNTMGYFYTITPSRKPDISVRFPVDRANLNKKNSSNLKAIVTSDPGSSIHFVLMYSTVPVDGKYPATIAKIYRSDGLSWSSNFMLSFLPTQIEYAIDSTDLIVKSDSELSFLLDKSGKVRQ